MQNPPRDERWLQRSLSDVDQRIRTLETTPKPFAGSFTVFATAADRTAVLTGPAEGDLSYQLDSNILYQYDGAAWVAVASAASYTAIGTNTSGLAAHLADHAADWTGFTPTWTGSVTNPALGNGTSNCAYQTIGTTVRFRIELIMGSTTTYGSGAFGLTLPVAPVNDHTAAAVYVDSSATLRFAGAAWLTPGAGVFRLLGPADAGNAGLSGTNLFAFGTNDQIIVSGVYETA